MRYALALLFLAACHTPTKRPTGATCADVCARGAALGCEYAKPSPGGVSCEAVCKDVVAGTDFVLDLECRAVASSCEAAERCEEGR